MPAKEKFNLVPVGGENCSAWSFRYKTILRENGVNKGNFSIQPGNQEKEAGEQTIIISGVAEYLLNHNTEHNMFFRLEENFKNRGIISRLFLRTHLSEVKYIEKEFLQIYFVL